MSKPLPPLRQGCLISQKELLESLDYLGAQRDPDGNFYIYAYKKDSMPPQAFLGISDPKNDILVDDSCYVLINKGAGNPPEKMSLLQVASRHGRGCAVTAIY